MKRVLALALIMLLVTVTGVLAFAEDPDKLIFVNVPVGNIEADMAQFEPILAHISAEVGIPVEYKIVTDYAAVLLAMQFGHADMARVGPFQAIQARALFGAAILVRDIKIATGAPFYYSVIIARVDLGLDPATLTADDLKGLSIAFVDPTSTSGYQVPLTMLRELGVFEEDFSKIYFAGSHASANIALFEGMVDIACTCEHRYIEALGTSMGKAGDTMILMQSDPLPTDPVIVRADLSADLKWRLLQAWLSVPPEAAAAFKLHGFAPTYWKDYEVIEQIAEALGLQPG